MTTFDKLRRKFSLPILLILMLCLTSCEAPYQNPPQSLKEKDLVGEWEVRYGSSGVDRLILYEDGTFKQVYSGSKGAYESQRNHWWLERPSDGFLRVHLEGAHYYAPGSNDEISPSYLYDPFLQSSVELNNELILHVRLDSSEMLLLHHLLLDPDAGFPLIGSDALIFRRTTKS
jgi:hypothetical protein